MSNVAHLITQLEDAKNSEEAVGKDSVKTSVTVRLEGFDVWKLDRLAERYNMKRSGISSLLLENAIDDGIKTLGLNNEEELEKYVELLNKEEN